MCEKPNYLIEHDSFIMDHVISSKMTRSKVNMVNKTRFFLKVETVDERAKLEGTRIDPAWLSEGSKPSWSTSKWPRVGKPSKGIWRAPRKRPKNIHPAI